MPKSLALSSNGMNFDEFMHKLVNAPMPEKKPRKPRGKRKKIAAPRGGR